jgi:hypothetical protein
VPATYIAVTPDVVMGDLLKTTRASQIFSIAGRPEIEINILASEPADRPPRWQVRLLGLINPVMMDVARLKGDDVPCWMLDGDYNGRVFMGTHSSEDACGVGPAAFACAIALATVAMVGMPPSCIDSTAVEGTMTMVALLRLRPS